METEYVRNLNHNYIKICSKESFFEYQVQMITRNNIEGLLNCTVERIDGKVYFLYEINSKQPFVQVFERKKIDIEAFKALIVCLKNAVENVGEYLLDVNSLVLLPEYIYMNPETKDIKLLYLPGAWRDIKEEFRELSRKLLEWIDYKDEEAVMAAYELQRRTCDENYSLNEILDEIILHKNESVVENEDISYEQDNIRSLNYKEDSYRKDENINYIKDVYYEEEYEGDEDEYEGQKLSLLKKLTAPVLEMAENMFKGFNSSRKEREYEEEEYEPVIKKAIKYEDYSNKYDKQSMIAEEETYGNTVFFQSAEHKKKRLLPYDTNKYSVFDLNIFPFIIGKLVEAVDGVIEEESVSRIHAKIEKVDGQFYLVDLNSTNGTYLNGKMIAPNEKTKLQTGDRLQFGFVEYHFEND